MPSSVLRMLSKGVMDKIYKMIALAALGSIDGAQARPAEGSPVRRRHQEVRASSHGARGEGTDA